MTVYFIREVGTEIVKIGSSKRPWHRLAQLQVGSPRNLELVGNSKIDDEKHYHRRFSKKRIRGEWFRLTDDDLASIEEAEFAPKKLWMRQIDNKIFKWYLP